VPFVDKGGICRCWLKYLPATIRGLPTAQQFICKKCRSLSNVVTFEETRDGGYFCRCTKCDAKNRIVMTGESPSRPGVLPVLGLLE
jgi:hypothetical protein